MSRPRDNRVRVGSGGRPASGGTGRYCDGFASMGPSVGGGGGRALRYSPGEEDTFKKEMEKTLRLRRLQQVREQSRRQAKEARQAYLQQRDESKRAALRDFKKQSEASRTTEMLALNERLQTKLLEVGTAHRLAACTNRVRELEQDRRRDERSKSEERRRTRNLAASKKRSAELMDSKKGVVVAEHRREVWRGEGEEGRIRAREEMMRQEASIAARRARAEVEARRFRQFAGENGTVQSTHANVFESGPRIEDFKKSRVHAALVLRHGTTTGARVMGVETASGNPAEESRRQEAQARERKEMEEKANSLAEKRGQEALMVEKDRQVVTRQEAELRRVHELDRRRRHTIGAAETNLAAKRRGRVNDSEWPMWWPPPPPHLRPDVGHSTSVGAVAMPVGKPRPAARPSTSPMPQEHERLRMLEETRQGLLRAAVRAEEQGRGRSASSVGVSMGSEGDELESALPVPSSGFVTSASAHSVSSAAAPVTAAVDVVRATAVSSSFASAPSHTSARASQIPSSSDSIPGEGTVYEALPPRSRTPASHVSSSRSPPSWQKHSSFVRQGLASDMRRVATAQGHRRTASEKSGRSEIFATTVPLGPARPSPKRTMEAVANQQYREALMSGEQWVLESSGDGGGYDGGRPVAETSRGEEADGEVRIPLPRQEADPGWNADNKVWQVDGSQGNTSEDVRSPSEALSLQPPPPPMVSSSAVASPDARQEVSPSPSTLGSPPVTKAVAARERGSYASVAVQMTPRSYVSVGVNTEELPGPERRQDVGVRDRAAAEDGRRLESVRRCNSAVQVGPEFVPFDGARSLPAVSTPDTSDPGRSVVTDREVDAGPVRPVGGRGDALDARHRASESISAPPVYAPARGDESASCPTTTSSSSGASLVQRPPLAPENLMRNLRNTSLGSARRVEGSIGGAPTRDTSSLFIEELESVQMEHTASALPQVPSPAIPAIREEREDHVRAPTAPWSPRFQREEDTAPERLEKAESRFGERESMASSSTSTLPQLDRELTELLERHRRLDKEASKLTRCAAGDALQWGGRMSSPGTVDTSSSSSNRDGVVPYTSSTNSRSSVSRVPAAVNGTEEKLLQSTNDFSVLEGGDLSSVALGTYIQHRAETGSRLSETISSRSSVRGRGIGGRDPVLVSRDHVPAETKPWSRPAAPEELGRWREGSVGSQSALRLSGQNSGTGVRWDVGVSPRGGVDTAPGVTEWARRIQASIESMNMLVDGFQVARTGTSGAGTIDHTVSTPVSASSPTTDTTTPGSGSRRGDSAQVKPDSVGMNEKQLHSEEGNEVPFVAAPGVESLASAQLGFRRGLRELLADMASGSPGGGEEALRFSPSTTSVATGAGCNLRNSHSSKSGDGRSEIGMSASLGSPPLPPAVNEEVKSREELSPSDMRPAWKERAATETQRAGTRVLDVELSRSSSSFTGRREAASAPSSGDGNGGGGREGSLLSSSSASFGRPDLNAEIASLEALGKSLQQRKIRFEPKPDLLVQQQRELEDCRRSIRSTTSSSVSRKPSELTESVEIDRMERGVKLNGTEESGLESSKENALAALDAFRADLDAWVAPDVSREVTALPSAEGGDSVNISFSDLRDVWSLMGEEKSHARQGSPSQSWSAGDDGDRVPESAMSSKSYDALMQEFLSVDADVIQRARAAIAGHVSQNRAGAAGSLVTGGGRGGLQQGRGSMASSEWGHLGVEDLAGSTRERIAERDGPYQGVLAPAELLDEKEERGDREELGEECADQGLRDEQGGEAAVKDHPEVLSLSTNRRVDFDAVIERCTTETPVAGPVGRASPAAVTADTIHQTVRIPSTSVKRDCNVWDDDYRREVSAPYACDRERDTSPTLRSARDGVGDNLSKKWVDLEEDGSRDGVNSPPFSALTDFWHRDVDDSNSLDSCGRGDSVIGVGVGGMTPSDSGSGIKLDSGVECGEISTALLALVVDTSVSDGDQGKADRSEADGERSEGSFAGVVDRARGGIVPSGDDDRREGTCEASGSEIDTETSLEHVGDDHEKSKADNILDAPSTVQEQSIEPDLLREPSRSEVDAATHGETSNSRSRVEFIGEASANSEGLGTACGDRDGEERSAVKEDSSGRAFSSGEALDEDEELDRAENKRRDRESLFDGDAWDERSELGEIGGVEEKKENWPPVTDVEATTNGEATLGGNERVGSHSSLSGALEDTSFSKNVNNSTVDSGSDPIYGSCVSDNTDISGGGGAALSLVGSDAEDRSSTMKEVSIKSGDSYDRGFPDVSMIRSEEEVRVGVDDSSYSWGGGCDSADVEDSGAAGEVQLEHANAEPRGVDEGEGSTFFRDASERISGEQDRFGSSQDVSWSSMGVGGECKASRTLVGSEGEIVSERCSMGDGCSRSAQSEEKDDSWVSRSRPGPGQAGSDGGKMTRMGGGSLEASEWSSDSMAAGRSQSKDGGNVMSPPKSGVAVAWDLGGPGAGYSKDGEAGHEGEGDLATMFRRRAPAFIERSQAREKELRQRREAREEARLRAATEAKAAAAAEAAASASATIPTLEPCEVRSPPPNEGRRKQEGVSIRGRSHGAGFDRSLSESAERDNEGRRKVSMKEARKRTARLYNSLPEVVKQREAEERNNQRIRRLLEARENEKQRSRFGKGKRQGGGGSGGVGDGT